MNASGMWMGRPRGLMDAFLVFGLCLLLSSPGLSRTPVVINEVMASNKATLADPQGQFDDWIELYNPDRVPVDIGGMYLTDDPAAPRKWQIPTGQANVTTIRPRGYLIVWADGDVADGGLHAGLRLDADGDGVYLFAADGVTLIDSLVFGKQTADVSYGRYPDGSETLRFFGVPTPGEANNEGYVGEVAPLRFSHERGFYDTGFDLTITTDTNDTQILYTTDGRAPNGSGYRLPPGRTYAGPIHIGATTCLRAMAVKPGWKPTEIYAHTYVLDFRTQLQSLPLVSLVGDSGFVFYEPNGVMAVVGGVYSGGVWTSTGAGSYNNIMNRDLERPVSAEWINWGGDDGFQIDCGLRVHGSPWMRPRYIRRDGLWSGDAKISFRLYFRGEYGQSRLEYPLFPLSEAEQFATVILRAGHNDRTNPFIKDELLRRLHKDMGQAACTGTFANLFIDGEYKGYYNPTEQLKEESCQQWFDSDKPWDVIAMDGTRDGDSVSWNDMINYARGHNLADPVYYAEMGKKLDVVSFIDYLIIRLWPNDWDWPQNNWAAACERSAAGRWKFFVWDAEGTFESNYLQASRFTELNNQNNANGYLYRALKASPDFRLLFADRLYQHFYNSGALTDENVRRRFFELASALYSVIPSMSTYIVDTWTPTRRDIFLNACVQEGMFTFAGPDLAVNGVPLNGGGQVSRGDRLSITSTAGRGTIYYTLDGTDPAQSDLQGTPFATALIPRDALKRVLIPTEPATDYWRSGRSFDDSSWLVSSGLPGGIGFGRGSGLEPYISTNLSSRMLNYNSSCYIRIPFRFEGDKDALSTLTLKMQYDDGFVAYLNSTEVARRNFEGEPAWDSAATVSRDNTAAVVFEPIDISAAIGNLRQGDNVLAIQGLNAALKNNDFLIAAELIAVQVPVSSAPVGRQVYADPISLTRTTQIKARMVSGTTWSALAEAVFAVGPVKESLRISEIMYHPAQTGPNTEYIELVNISGAPVNLSFVRFTRGIRFTFPDMELAPHAFCVVVKDRAAFEACYGKGLPVAGQYTGSLSDGGEWIELLDAAGAVIHSFRYQDDWFRATDGQGFSLTIQHPASAPVSSWSTPGVWRPSTVPGGSPGSDDSGVIPEADAVVINELLTNPADGGSDWVELYNTTNKPIDLGGWFLSDDADILTKYEIAKGTILAAGAYLVLTENRHFGNLQDPGCREPFGLSRAGESVYLCSGDGGRVTGYRQRAKFGPADAGLTFGRYADSAGGAHLVPLRGATPGAANDDPSVGPVVINEIMYHSGNPGDVEYVSLLNTGQTEMTLSDPARGVPWRLSGGSDEDRIELLLPQDPPIRLAPGAYMLLTKDQNLFLSRYTVPSSVLVLEWGFGSLRDAGDTVELCRPGDLDNDIRTWVVVDRVTYSDGAHPENFPSGLDPWPVQANGRGQALVRLQTNGWGDDPLNWQAATPSPGTVRPRGNR